VLIGILSLQGDFSEHRAAFAELGAGTRAVRRVDDLLGVDGIVVPGGESTTISMLLESSGLSEAIAKHLTAGLPVFGTCAGMILLARKITDGRPDQKAYGAIDLVVRRNGYGRQLDSFECDLSVESLGTRPLHAVFIRAPMVEAAGPDVEVLARIPPPETALGPAGAVLTGERLATSAAHSSSAHSSSSSSSSYSHSSSHSTPVVCRQGPVLVTAFHPELTDDRRLHALFVSMVENREREV
jgi:5'-phosphate synthase pdxT subunit